MTESLQEVKENLQKGTVCSRDYRNQNKKIICKNIHKEIWKPLDQKKIH
jgi:hypothetical protein